MSFLRPLGYVFAALGLIGTLLPLLPYDDYWIRMFDYPRVQLLLCLALGTLLIWRGRAGARRTPTGTAVRVLCAGCILFQAYRILPYTPVWAKQVPDAAAPADGSAPVDVHLLMSNVLQDNRDYARLLALVDAERPDILLTLESDQAWQDALDAGLPETYAHTVKVPLDNRYGMHLYSSLPLRRDTILHLITDSIPSIHTQVQLASGAWIELYCVHPTPPSPTEESASTGRDGELALVGRRVRAHGNGNTIVAGDLNDVAWSHSTRLFQRLSGLLDPRRGRGLFASFHADYWPARWPLDHVFHAAEFQLVDLRRLRAIGSDHFPMSVTLRHVPSAAAGIAEPEPERDDLEEADETIDSAREGEVDGLIIEE